MERLIIEREGRVVADPIVRTSTRWARLRGLIGRRSMSAGEALHLEPAKQVHTLGMHFPIDVLFCDRDLRVVYVVHSMRPARLSRFVAGAHSVFEMQAGGAAGISPGDRLAFVSRTSDSCHRSR